MLMTNYQHFYEASIIANYAMKHPDPLGRGLESGRKYLMYLRKQKCPDFCEELFNEYAKSYIAMARLMVKERTRFVKHNRVGKMKHRLEMGLPAVPVPNEKVQQKRKLQEAIKDFS
jgi:hypothetical protein